MSTIHACSFGNGLSHLKILNIEMQRMLVERSYASAFKDFSGNCRDALKELRKLQEIFRTTNRSHVVKVMTWWEPFRTRDDLIKADYCSLEEAIDALQTALDRFEYVSGNIQVGEQDSKYKETLSWLTEQLKQKGANE